MTSKSDQEELASLERETEELRNRREERASEPEDRSTDDVKDPARALALPLESIVGELEEAVRERPVLTLLAVFGAGVLVGKLLAR